MRFGLNEPRLKDGGAGFTCNTDFISRVNSEVGRKGRVAIDGGTAPAPSAGSEVRPSTVWVQGSPMEQAIHSARSARPLQRRRSRNARADDHGSDHGIGLNKTESVQLHEWKLL